MTDDKVLNDADLKQPSNIWRHGYSHPLAAIFSPKNVAVIGASERPKSVGRTLVWNLISNPFGGTVFPVNPKRNQVLGLKAYSTIAELPEPVDLAVIATPAATVPDILGECVQAGVKGAIVISAGFREIGEEGVRLEEKTLQEAKRGNVRIIGPNCLGVINPIKGLNATFASAMAKPGNVGFLSQSGALCTAVLDWSLRENVGFSAFVSLGSMLDVGWGDLITYLGDDPNTKSILIYMESVGDARAFLSAAREVALTKPIIVIKAGRTEAAAKAAATHTGSLAGSDEVLDAAFRRSGVLRVNSISDLFYMAEVLGKQPRPTGPRLTVLTNAGGPGVLATDSLILEGGELATLSEETLTSMNEFLPSQWSHSNPIDLLGDADPQRYQKAFQLAAGDENTDGLLVILTPQSMTQPSEVAKELRKAAEESKRPILASWMGGEGVAEGEDILNEARIPTFGYPDTAARVFALMWRYSSNLRSLYETPIAVEESQDPAIGRIAAEELIRSVRNSGRNVLTEFESKNLLASYGIPCINTVIADDQEHAQYLAEQIGYPVVLKLHSETITHKTDVNGVQLNLQDEVQVREAYHIIKSSVAEKAGAEHFLGVTVQPMIKWAGYELIIGSTHDPQFGPVLLFGSGGQLVEVFKDRALALPPLTTTLAELMMEQTHISTALKGVRGRKPVDLHALQQLLVRFSQLVAEQPAIKEIEINPLLASSEQLIAVDARAILHGFDISKDDLPNLAIRPYPIEYVSTWELKDRTPITLRPIRADDEPLMVKFHALLSDRSVYLRYLHLMSLDARVTHERLTRICFNDYDREIALVAIYKNLDDGVDEIMGVCRLIKAHGSKEAEFSLLVADPFQGQGLGNKLLETILDVAQREGIKQVNADIHPENRHMRELSKKLGFQLQLDQEDRLLRATISLA